ncbi:Phosphoribosylformylglycinamidine cyclo-ligase [Limihaloglobus sulfuriphilus]|uniref:Phosphoribosylformylglycinamidine cyclo-ligase n=1 Tax=Limihaloglobus sulfuriphilus TaxID=1851148 RepID=A0A1Q2MIA3_9BACT|nr:phosphoribosylformylglycinamidine cyclo-ligase [Limihaloglobus sulfuriphilus]AQQ72410.1 Phosphoribosylformylglycinamidine cyclo-ligase [Limihaloglobus sulfuriphilus]
MSEYLSYEQSGVSIDANDRMVERIKDSVARTHSPRVINLHGGFAGLFSLENSPDFKKNYKNPVLVSCTDGVGTKVILAKEMQKFDTVGTDLVAMSVNDMIVMGAEPLFFLDYLAVDKLDPERVAEMVSGIAKACEEAGCALIGGETAEMPDLYSKNEFDMAGFAVGVVERDRIIKGDAARPGDVLLGLASSGIHSNGFSLVRKICFEKAQLGIKDTVSELGGKTLGSALLEPTRIYVQPIVKLLEQYPDKCPIHAMAHITGGGLVGNIPRVLPENCDAVIDRGSWDVPEIFKWLEKLGPVEEREMFRVFNMGIGYVMAVDADEAENISKKLAAQGQRVYRIGTIEPGGRKVKLI